MRCRRAWIGNGHPARGIIDWLLSLDREAEAHSDGTSSPPVRGRRQAALLSGSSHSLDRKQTKRRVAAADWSQAEKIGRWRRRNRGRDLHQRLSLVLGLFS